MKKALIIFSLMLLLGTDMAHAAGCGWFRGKPLPDCKSFWVLETGWEHRIHDTNTRGNKDKFLFTSSLGHMRNLTEKYSLGGTLYLGADDDGSLFGVCARGRLWLNRITSIDLDLGPILAGGDNFIEVRTPGFIGRLSFGVGDLFALTAHYQAVRFEKLSYLSWDPVTGDPVEYYSDKGVQSGWFIGVRFGSYAAMIFPLIIIAILIGQSGEFSTGTSYY